MLLLIPRHRQKAFRLIALCTTLLQVIGVVLVLRQFSVGLSVGTTTPGSLQLVEQCAWMHLNLGSLGTLSIHYFLGVDGLNISLLLLAAVTLVIGVVASCHVQSYTKAYFALYLLLDTLIIGSFVALDFLLFYSFFEAALIPLYFFIGLWGGPQRTYAATKFFLYTLLGTIPILMVLIGLGLSVYDPVATGIQAGILTQSHTISPEKVAAIQSMVQTKQIAAKDIVHTLNLTLMSSPDNFVPDSILSPTKVKLLGGQAVRLLAFLSLLMGFLIKLATFPFHSWLPAAHVEAPTPISILLAAILLKVGGYGLLRTAYSIFPEGALYYSFWIGILGLISISYAALNALAMQDLKRMIAYASIAHMGFFLLGLASLTHEGINGALYQMVSHGFISAMLFLVAGVIEERTHDRSLENYSGLATPMPHYTTMAMLAFLAALGMPGFSGFIAELLILLGAFQSSSSYGPLPTWLGIGGAVGILLNATYWVWTIQRMFWGRFSLRFPAWKPSLQDLYAREYGLLIPLIILILALGLFPRLLLDLIKDTVSHLVTTIYQVGRENLKLIMP